MFFASVWDEARCPHLGALEGTVCHILHISHVQGTLKQEKGAVALIRAALLNVVTFSCIISTFLSSHSRFGERTPTGHTLLLSWWVLVLAPGCLLAGTSRGASIWSRKTCLKPSSSAYNFPSPYFQWCSYQNESQILSCFWNLFRCVVLLSRGRRERLLNSLFLAPNTSTVLLKIPHFPPTYPKLVSIGRTSLIIWGEESLIWGLK